MTAKEIVELSAVNIKADISSAPLLDRIYKNRGLTSAEDVNYKLADLLPPNTMLNLEKAADLVIEHAFSGKIIVVGDYDVDGGTAISVAMEGFKRLGINNASFIVPDRMVHGYGLTPSIVEMAGKEGPSLILTVDNGIASFEGAKAVKNLPFECDLLVTDHHLPAVEGLPDATVIVNPSQPYCKFESKALCGCGVMFYLIMAVRAKMRERELISSTINDSIIELIDLVSLATIADVVPLDKNNRILVQIGLNRIRAGKVRHGIRSLLELGGRTVDKIVSSDFGFTVGPRINSAGRLDDMTIGIRCLLAEDREDADRWANMLNDLNKERKEIESEMVEGANEILKDYDLSKMKTLNAACLYSGDWHEGVIGILSSRVKERLNRPVVCFTDTKERRAILEKIKKENEKHLPSRKVLEALYEEAGNSEIKGSARSLPGIHLKHILDKLMKAYPDILVKMGGHAMAAGMTIRYKGLKEFSLLLNEAVASDAEEGSFSDLKVVDIKDMNSDDITLPNAELLRYAGPWGQGFLEPKFSGVFHVDSFKMMKEKHIKMVLSRNFGGEVFEAILFNYTDHYNEDPEGFVEIVFRLDLNEWRGRKSIQLMVEFLQPYDKELKDS